MSISYSCLGKIEADTPVFFVFLLISFFEQVPTPEGKQHTGGQRGQSSIWTQPLPTDRACQSLSRTLRGAEPPRHLGLTPCQALGQWLSRKKGGCLLNPGLSVSMQTPCNRAHVVQAPSSQRPTAALRGLNGRPNEPIIPRTKFMDEGQGQGSCAGSQGGVRVYQGWGQPEPRISNLICSPAGAFQHCKLLWKHAGLK